jgi:hypothetical protein
MHVVHAKSDYMDREPSSSEYSVSSTVLNGITNQSTIVEMLARFVTNNAAYLKSLGMNAERHGNNFQATWLNAFIVESEEDFGKPGEKHSWQFSCRCQKISSRKNPSLLLRLHWLSNP